MNITIKYQKFNKYINEYLGEDSDPFINEDIMVVANGMKGRGEFSHINAKPEILNKEKFDKYIKSVIVPSEFWMGENLTTEIEKEDYERVQEIIDFVNKNFHELFSMAEQIKKNPMKMKKSSYFAPRLLIASFLMTMNNSSVLNALRMLDGESIKKWVNEKEGIRDQILLNLKKFAKILGLKNDSKTFGHYLLPSSITSCITFENQDSVDVIYMWAGNSRGMVWTKEFGLQQVTKDHAEDGNIYNLFKLDSTPDVAKEYSEKLPLSNDGFIPILEFRKYTFKKPCFIFNITEGMYGNECFVSPLDFEYTLLETILQSKNIEEVERKLERTYNNISTLQDSGTLSGKIYGYKNFEELKKEAFERMNDIKSLYISQMPEIVYIDFMKKLHSAKRQFEDAIIHYLPVFRNDPYIKEYIHKNMKDVYKKKPSFLRLAKQKLKELKKELLKTKYELSIEVIDSWKIINGYNTELTEELLKEYVEELISIATNTSPENAFEITDTLNQKIISYLQRYIDILNIIETKEYINCTELSDEVIDEIWYLEGQRIVRKIWINEKYKLSSDTLSIVNKRFKKIEEEIQMLEKKIEKCKEIYEQYEFIYNYYLN